MSKAPSSNQLNYVASCDFCWGQGKPRKDCRVRVEQEFSSVSLVADEPAESHVEPKVVGYLTLDKTSARDLAISLLNYSMRGEKVDAIELLKAISGT